MTLTFPIKTVKDIVYNFKKHTIDEKSLYVTSLIKEKERVVLGKTVLVGNEHKIHGFLSQESGWGEWIGEIHSNPYVKDKEAFSELEKGMSEDDVNHIVSGTFKGNYKKFPAVFCAATPTRDTNKEFWLEVQCEKYDKIDAETLSDIPRSAKPSYDPFNLFFSYPKDTPIGKIRISSISETATGSIQDDNINRWKKGCEKGEIGYPFPIDVNIWEDEYVRTGAVRDTRHALAIKSILFYQADMASIKKGLRNKGLLTSDEFTIKCKKLTIGRQKKTLMVCSYGEQTLNL